MSWRWMSIINRIYQSTVGVTAVFAYWTVSRTNQWGHFKLLIKIIDARWTWIQQKNICIVSPRKIFASVLRWKCLETYLRVTGRERDSLPWGFLSDFAQIRWHFPWEVERICSRRSDLYPQYPAQKHSEQEGRPRFQIICEVDLVSSCAAVQESLEKWLSGVSWWNLLEREDCGGSWDRGVVMTGGEGGEEQTFGPHSHQPDPWSWVLQRPWEERRDSPGQLTLLHDTWTPGEPSSRHIWHPWGRRQDVCQECCRTWTGNKESRRREPSCVLSSWDHHTRGWHQQRLHDWGDPRRRKEDCVGDCSSGDNTAGVEEEWRLPWWQESLISSGLTWKYLKIRNEQQCCCVASIYETCGYLWWFRNFVYCLPSSGEETVWKSWMSAKSKESCKVSSGSQSCRLKFVTITVTTSVTSHRDEEVRGEIFHRPPSFDSLAKLITNTASTSNL